MDRRADKGIAVSNFLPEKDSVPYLDERLAGRAHMLLHEEAPPGPGRAKLQNSI